MWRRLLPTISGLALGFAVLLVGLISLERVFRRERAEARATVADQRRALEQYARRALEQRLEDDLRAARGAVPAALLDPLLPSGHLLWVDGDRQLLPRFASPRPGAGSPARDLFATLLAGRRPAAAAEPGSPWHRQLALQEAFNRALEQRREREIEASFRAILYHRSRFRIAPELDLPATLALLEAFRRRGSPAPELFQALLHDGLDDGHGGRLRDLQRLLLEHRDQFSRGDFLFLSERLVELATAHVTPYQAFLDRSREASPGRVVLPPEVAEAMLADGGRWLVTTEGDAGRRLGVATELPALLRDVAEEMRQRSLLAPGDEVTAAALPRHLPVSRLELAVSSPRWPRQLAAIDERYRLKAALVLLSASLAAAMAALAIALQARRLRLVELKSDFVATVSHELRTPLAAVRLMAETVAKRATAPELKDYPDRIVREIDGLIFLIENILSFNRLERGRVAPRLARLPLDDLLREIRSEVELQAPRDVVFSAPASGAVLRADRELMKLLFLNLARNACLYNDRRPIRISITQRPVADRCEVLVRDNGRGIPRRERRRIFEEFYRPRGGSATGTGLGLTICRRIVELHRGRIRVADSGPEGTTFRFDLPA